MAEIKARGLELGGKRLVWGARTYVMGILNLTEDSFSGDGLLSASSDPEGYIQNALKARACFCCRWRGYLGRGRGKHASWFYSPIHAS